MVRFNAYCSLVISVYFNFVSLSEVAHFVVLLNVAEIRGSTSEPEE